MAPPVHTRVGARLADELLPLAAHDPDNGYALGHYLAACARLLDEVADYSGDREDGTPGWGWLFDPDAAPDEALEWLRQFNGVAFAAFTDAATRRARLKSTDGFRRGTPAALLAAVRPLLTGTQTVYLTERWGGPYGVRLATLASETPFPAAVSAAAMDQKPLGLVLTFQTLSGAQDFNALRDTHQDFADVAATYVDLNEIRDNPTK